MTISVTVQIFARAPLLGQVKSRLGVDVGRRQCLHVYRALLARTVRTVADAGMAGELWVAGSPSHPFLRALSVRYRVPLRVQRGTDLGERMWRAMRAGLERSMGIILIGSDCPGLAASQLLQARDLLGAPGRVVIGPSADGGYYLVAARRARRGLFRGIEWGTSRVLGQTRRRLRALGLMEHSLTELSDLDDGALLSEFARGKALLERPIVSGRPLNNQPPAIAAARRHCMGPPLRRDPTVTLP